MWDALTPVEAIINLKATQRTTLPLGDRGRFCNAGKVLHLDNFREEDSKLLREERSKRHH